MFLEGLIAFSKIVAGSAVYEIGKSIVRRMIEARIMNALKPVENFIFSEQMLRRSLITGSWVLRYTACELVYHRFMIGNTKQDLNLPLIIDGKGIHMEPIKNAQEFKGYSPLDLKNNEIPNHPGYLFKDSCTYIGQIGFATDAKYEWYHFFQPSRWIFPQGHGAAYYFRVDIDKEELIVGEMDSSYFIGAPNPLWKRFHGSILGDPQAGILKVFASEICKLCGKEVPENLVIRRIMWRSENQKEGPQKHPVCNAYSQYVAQVLAFFVGKVPSSVLESPGFWNGLYSQLIETTGDFVEISSVEVKEPERPRYRY